MMIRIRPSRRYNQWGFVAFMLLLFLGGAQLHALDPRTFPWPSDVFSHIFRSAIDLPALDVQNHLGSVGYLHMFMLTAVSYVFAVLFGVVMFTGLAVGTLFSKRLVAFSRATIDVLRMAPPILLIPVAYALIPHPQTPPLFSLFYPTDLLVPGFVGGIYTWATLSLYLIEIDPKDPRNAHIKRIQELASLLALPRRTVLVQIYLKSLLPNMLLGLRNSTSIALGVIFVAEWMLGPVGLGHVVRTASSSMDWLTIYGAIFLAIALTLAFDILYGVLHYHIRRQWMLAH